jgi:hypothetical protein
VSGLFSFSPSFEDLQIESGVFQATDIALEERLDAAPSGMLECQEQDPVL